MFLSEARDFSEGFDVPKKNRTVEARPRLVLILGFDLCPSSGMERSGVERGDFERPERYDPEARPKSLTQMGFDFRKTYFPERSAAKEK